MFVRHCQIVLALTALYCALPGCGKSGADAAPASDPKVLLNMHCSKCHAQPGEPGGPQQGTSKGPSLQHVGSEPGHDADWIARYIRDSRSVRPESKMPKFEGMIKEEELRALAEFLANQK
ncbi:MAG TPA: c-type cytochrome [Gemmata sp.]|jgi:mono/diheme cytochrome c family protein|nr:c-type cytochrome [Gemmata sp.]